MSFSFHALPFETSLTTEPSRPQTSRTAAFLARLGCWFRTAPSHDELSFQSTHMLADIGLRSDDVVRFDVRAYD